MKSLQRVLKILFIILIMLQISGCSAQSVDKIKVNGSAVQEYNEAIKVYNKVAISFTDLARTVDKESQKSEKFSEGFWRSYEGKKEKVLQNIDLLKDLKFEHQEIGITMDIISPMLSDIELYIERMETLKGYLVDDTRNDIMEENSSLYKNILNQSSAIIDKFNLIYDEYIIAEKK